MFGGSGGFDSWDVTGYFLEADDLPTDWDDYFWPLYKEVTIEPEVIPEGESKEYSIYA